MSDLKAFFSKKWVKKSIVVVIYLLTIVSSALATACNYECKDTKDRKNGLIHGSYPWLILASILLLVYIKFHSDDDLFMGFFLAAVVIGIASSGFAIECAVACKDTAYDKDSKTNVATYGVAGFTISFTIVFGLLVAYANFTD